jgi:quercetin dioxygenase-like cupin family protein
VKFLKTGIAGAMILTTAIAASLATETADGFIRVTPEQVPFTSAAGVEQRTLFGDPNKPGIYVVRVRFPPGMHSNPHYHSQDRHVTVVKGVWLMGVGDKADVTKAVAMKTGSYAFHPARGVHWDGAGDEEAIVQIIGMGPVQTVQVDPKAPPMGQWALPVKK